MARIRTIKPGFFTNADLYDAERQSGLPCRVAYAGLWTVADREGRFKWRPRELKLAIIPYDDVDMAKVLEALASHGFIVKYKCAHEDYGMIPKFQLHQFINKNEAQSTIPAPSENSNASTENDARIEPHQPSTEITYEYTVVSDTRHKTQKAPIGALDAREGQEVEPQPVLKPKVVKGTRWSADAEIPDAWLSEAAALRIKHQLPPIDLRLEATRFANYWASKAGGGAIRVDWRKTWLNWVLNANGKQKNGDGRHEKSRGHSAFLEGAFLSAQDDPLGNAGGEPS